MNNYRILKACFDCTYIFHDWQNRNNCRCLLTKKYNEPTLAVEDEDDGDKVCQLVLAYEAWIDHMIRVQPNGICDSFKDDTK